MSKKKVLSPEELAERDAKLNEENLQRQLADLRREHISKNPTYKFNPGDEVVVGAHQKTVVLEVLDESTIYLVECTNVTERYGKNITDVHKFYFDWTHLRKINNETHSFSVQEDIILRYYNQHISSLILKVHHNGVDMNPEYQREHVWTIEDKVFLIDSMFHNVDIGKFVFVERSYEETKAKGNMHYEILDGKQRLSAIVEFYEDRFEYKGKKFSDLSVQDQRRIYEYPVSTAEVYNYSLEKRIELFVKLNTTGRVMDKDHLEKVKKMLLK